MCPGPAFRATPCLIAFSTSGCSSRLGTSASSVSGWTSKRTTRRSAKRVCSICEVFRGSRARPRAGPSCCPEMLERDAQQVAQLHQRAIGGVHVPVHQRRDRVQRVEQEVRVELLLQRLELRLDQPGFELRRPQLARARLAVVEERVAQADDRPVGHHLPVELEERRRWTCATTRKVRPSARASHQCTASMPAMCVNEKTITPAGGRRRPAPAAPRELEVLRQPDDRRRHQRPQVPPGEVEDDQRAEAGRPLADEARELPGQRRRQQPSSGRDDEDVQPPHDARAPGWAAAADRCRCRGWSSSRSVWRSSSPTVRPDGAAAFFR